ncbi:hypothetical protein PoB_003605500 [Plakobranchus ocellatus]|uniref:Uncharacterized protein n=1 Tax=Plakobranchus ocellatus TaxID=259542 RepID=A0AAV4AMV2_9GAST|nr:hypothetical protein PoB_003605500 [Plakobranchus ocellatus]
MGKLQALFALLCFALLVSTSFAMPVEDEEERGLQKRFVLVRLTKPSTTSSLHRLILKNLDQSGLLGLSKII